MEHIKMSCLCFPHILATALQSSLGSFFGPRSRMILLPSWQRRRFEPVQRNEVIHPPLKKKLHEVRKINRKRIHVTANQRI